MPHTTTDDVGLYYEVFGREADPLVVLISGGGAQLLSWRTELIDLLVAEGFRVVRFDNRDTGLSRRFGGPEDIDGGYSVSDLGDDVVRVLDTLGVEAAHLVGHSMGGIMAQMVAIEHPERVLSLGLLSTLPGRDDRYVGQPDPGGERTAPVPLPRDVLVAGAGEYARVAGSERYPIDVEWMQQAAGEAFDRGNFPDGFARQWSALLRQPERLGQLRSVTAPALVFHGREDDVVLWQAAVEIAAAMPEAELQVHSGMGHLIPDALWPVLVDGIARTARRGEALAARER
ncbi:alpha/beta fold hydrolase [Agrococcus sp. Marseille-P2731]|uniref:alpha/beta fold hydrolase n=1 Tax=Agrococcus sp. Marseille-P2731 TaxID=1841862 RepID=UPI0009311A54|nr:alpha/beta hydrolase [Agrococcus sp. Marseille-P2731]